MLEKREICVSISFLLSFAMEVEDLDIVLVYGVVWRFEFDLGVGFDFGG